MRKQGDLPTKTKKRIACQLPHTFFGHSFSHLSAIFVKFFGSATHTNRGNLLVPLGRHPQPGGGG